MKLIAETKEESAMIDGVTALLCDLGIDTDSYRREEAIAVTLFHPEDLSGPASFHCMTEEEQRAFLISIEDNIRKAMLDAGYKTICRAFSQARGISHPDLHFG